MRWARQPYSGSRPATMRGCWSIRIGLTDLAKASIVGDGDQLPGDATMSAGLQEADHPACASHTVHCSKAGASAFLGHGRRGNRAGDEQARADRGNAHLRVAASPSARRGAVGTWACGRDLAQLVRPAAAMKRAADPGIGRSFRSSQSEGSVLVLIHQLVGADPGHHGAELRAGLLDGMGGGGLAARLAARAVRRGCRE